VATFTLTGTVLVERLFTATVEANTIEEARQKILANFQADPVDYVSDDVCPVEFHSIEWD